jgi:hypothetical protein
MVWVAAGGPATNITLAILAALAFHLVGYLPVTALQYVSASATRRGPHRAAEECDELAPVGQSITSSARA